MKSLHSQIGSYLATGLVLGFAFVKATCPEKPIDKVQRCTSDVLPELNSFSNGPRAYTTHVQNARDSCGDSRLQGAADCIQDILDKCRGTTEDEQFLHKLIDKEKTIGTVDYFCRHLRVYEKHTKCIARHHDEVVLCSTDAHKSFKTRTKTGATMDVLIEGSCRFHAVARTCLANTTEYHCGREAANFVFTILTGLMPPYCELSSYNPEYKPVYNGINNDRWDTDSSSDHNNSDVVLPQTLMLTLTWLSWMMLNVV